MKKHALKLGILTLSLFALFGCGQGTEITSTGGIPTSDEPTVKKSTSGICHEEGSTYYDRTSNFEPYDSIEDCLNSGGRLPKK